MAVGKAGYRKTLFGNQTITTASDGDAQKEGQVGAANIFGGAPKIRFPGGPAAGQPSFAQLQGEGLARPAPQVAPTGDPEGLLGSVSAQLAAGYQGQPGFIQTPDDEDISGTGGTSTTGGSGGSGGSTGGSTGTTAQSFRHKPRSGSGLSGFKATMGSGDGDTAYAAMGSIDASQDNTGDLSSSRKPTSTNTRRQKQLLRSRSRVRLLSLGAASRNRVRRGLLAYSTHTAISLR